MKKTSLYILGILISLVLFALCFTVFAHTEVIGGILIGLGAALFVLSLIGLCRSHEKIKKAIKAIIEVVLS